MSSPSRSPRPAPPGDPDADLRIPLGHVDLWAIADGQILIGEAKKSDRLETTARNEKARCAALNALARAVTADQVVLATSSGHWGQRTRDNVTKITGPAAPIRWIEGLDEHQP